MTGMVVSFAFTGFFLALMDIRQFYVRTHSVFRFMDSLGLTDWYLGTGGNKRWRKYWLVWDAWHCFKNLMLISIGIGTEFAVGTSLTWELPFLVPPIIGLSFIGFFHGVFGATWE